jgi:hypothetical protein
MLKKVFVLSILVVIFAMNVTAQSMGKYLPVRATGPTDGSRSGYVILATGEKVVGERVDIGGGFRTIIIVDKVKYKLNEVKVVQTGNTNLTNVDNTLYQTIVAGEKISVFRKGLATYNEGKYESINTYYYRKADGSMKHLRNMEDITEAIGDCKSTADIKNLDNRDLKEKCKEKHYFLIEYFERYNKECN